jgi:penicillin amidase
MQITAPGLNVYGVTFPGAPSIIIGFNDSCAFGVTNASRDVKDYFQIRFRDETMREYWFNNDWRLTDFRYEHIAVKGRDEIIDTVAYTVFGPVVYDKKFTGGGRTNGDYYAMRWKALDPSNELMAFNLLDHARNYRDYSEGIKWLHTPGQNFVFASKNGDIAIWDQGEFPAKWKYQGEFIMPGIDSTYMWKGNIPQEENPHQINPERGFVSSANQFPADPAAYPYYLGGSFPPYRGLIINRKLSQMNNISPGDMMKMQTDNYNIFAEMAIPVYLKYLDEGTLDDAEKKYFDILKNWDHKNDINEKGATVFYVAWDYFEKEVWYDELSKTKLPLPHPVASALLEGILRDPEFSFLDNITTSQRETLQEDLTNSFKKAAAALRIAESDGRLIWDKYKDTKVGHLARLAPFSRLHLPIGGGTHCINATKEDHGPSWRMVVSLTDTTEAFAVYPGGQSGNPGSPYYDNFIDYWVEGKYYTLWVMNETQSEDKRVKFKMSFAK